MSSLREWGKEREKHKNGTLQGTILARGRRSVLLQSLERDSQEVGEKPAKQLPEAGDDCHRGATLGRAVGKEKYPATPLQWRTTL